MPQGFLRTMEEMKPSNYKRKKKGEGMPVKTHIDKREPLLVLSVLEEGYVYC